MKNRKRVFLDATAYNEAIKGSEFHNCFAAAMSITRRVKNDMQFNLKDGQDIGLSFIMLCNRYKINVKQVSSMADVKGKYAFVVLGWFPVKVSYFLFYDYKYIDFHVFRINPDGTILNKADFTSPAKDLKNLDEPDLYDYREELRLGDYKIFVLDDE